MLNNVPTQVNRSARLVTLNHPNTMVCFIAKKVSARTDPTLPTTMGGLPTLEGLGLLSLEDEAAYGKEELGEARILFAQTFQVRDNNWRDNDTGLIFSSEPDEASIECLAEPDSPDFFVPDVNDIVHVNPYADITMPYIIVGVTGAINIPPYTRKYILQSMADQGTGI